jgi:membrane fusion protein (multidrug efflux system)
VRDGKAARVPLTLGYSEGAWVEVRQGLAVGDAVVVAGKAALREGSEVQVIGATAAAAPAAANATAKAPQ